MYLFLLGHRLIGLITQFFWVWATIYDLTYIYVKLSPRDLNPSAYPPQPTNT